MLVLSTQDPSSSEALSTIPSVFAAAVLRWPNKLCLDFLGQRFTYAELEEQVAALASGLQSIGVRQGHTVASLLDNSPDAICTFLAVTRLGAIYAPLNTALRGELLRHQLSDSTATIVFAEHDFADRILAIEGDLPLLATIVVRGAFEQRNSRYRFLPISDVRTLKSVASSPEIKVEPSDLAMLIYTSGTTGPSKGCMLTHNYPCNMARRMVETTGRCENDVVWSPLPLFHISAVSNLLLATMSVGASIALYPRFSVSNFWPEVERTRATHVSLMGAMIALIAAAQPTEVSTRCFGQVHCVTGAPFPPEVVDSWRAKFGGDILGSHAYGLTEASPIAYRRLGAERPGSSGVISDDFEVRVVGESGQTSAPGEPGELWVRPNRPNVMFEGYWRNPAATLASMKQLWFQTGDIVSVDNDGYLTFRDRKKDYLRRSGENISSGEMESIYRRHPDIEDVAVHAVPSEFSEDELKVTAILRTGATLTEEALCVWAVERVPYFAVPQYIEFRTELPRTPTGRVQKHELRAEGVTKNTWDRDQSSVKVEKR